MHVEPNYFRIHPRRRYVRYMDNVLAGQQACITRAWLRFVRILRLDICPDPGSERGVPPIGCRVKALAIVGQ